MLFHGTSKAAVQGILTEGFKNSEKGLFGRGVYMTDLSSTARHHGLLKSMTDCLGNAALYCSRFNENTHIFVNEVLESHNMWIIEHSRNESMFDRYSKPEHQFEKHVYERSQSLTEEDFKKDFLGRKYRNVAVGEPGEYLADKSLVIPRYLIEIGSTLEC